MSRVGVLFVGVLCSCTPFSSTPDVVAAGDAAPDIGVDIDASGDALAPTDGGSEGCRELVVDGFERDQVDGPPWDALTQQGATLTFDTTEKAHGERSLLFQLMAPNGKGYLTKRFAAVKHVCCELNVQTNGPASARFLEFNGNSENNLVALSWLAGKGQIVERAPGPPVFTRVVTSIGDAASWTHLRVEAEYGAGATMGTLAVYTNGVLTQHDTLGNTTNDLQFDTILLGSFFSMGTDRKIWFDDVACGAR